MKYAIKCQDLRKTFDGKEFILDGIDLKVEQGSITVIIGSSGAGKSVLLKHFLGLISPTEGNIEILGKSLNMLNDDELKDLRKKYGVVFQNDALFNDMSLVENVLFPLREHFKQPFYQLYNLAYNTLLALDIKENQFKKLPSEISGGMQKRIALARALVLEPKLLFYDEPTTGLDPITKSTVNELIVKTHKKSQGLTSVIVSHDLSSSLRIADKVAMIASGKILLYGTPEEFRNSKLDHVQRFIEMGINNDKNS